MPNKPPISPRVRSFDGTEIVYDVYGSGSTALVLIHGWSCDRGYWDEQLEPLSAHHQVVTLDLAGHGESGSTRQDWTMASFGQDAVAVIKNLGLDKVVLVGSSMGGDVILEAALRARERVVGLVWVDTYNQLEEFKTPEVVKERMAPIRANFVEATRAMIRGMFPPSADPTLVERVVIAMSAAPPDIALAAMESAWNYGRTVPATLAQLNLPVLAINAPKPPTNLESMRRHGVDVVIMEGVGHYPMLEAPEEFNRILLNAVAGFGQDRL